MSTDKPIEIRFVVDATHSQTVIDNLTCAGWSIAGRSIFPPYGVHLVLHLDEMASIPGDTQDAPYKRLVRDMVTPLGWRVYFDGGWQVVRDEHREACLQTGMKRFHEAFCAGDSHEQALRTARTAVTKKASSLEKAYQRGLKPMPATPTEDS